MSENKNHKPIFHKRSIKQESKKDFAELLREREQDSSMDDRIKEIYQDDGPNKKDNSSGFGGLQRRTIDAWTKISVTFLILLGVISLVSWLSFFLFNSGSRLRTDDIEFSIVGPEEVIAGEEVVYELQYKNISKFNLRDLQFDLSHSSNVIILDSVPAMTIASTNKSTNVWQVDSLDIKRSGRIEIKVMIIAPVDSEHEFLATMSYRPENFSSAFNTDATVSTKVASLGVNIGVESPSFFNVDDEATIKISYAAQRQNYLKNFHIRLDSSEDFILSKNSTAENFIAQISEQKDYIEIKGLYKDKPEDGNLKLIFYVPEEIVDKNEAKTIEHVFAQYDIGANVAAGALQLSLTANGSSGAKAVSIGDKINYILHYKNNSEARLKNVIIMATIRSAMADIESLQGSNDAERRDNSVIWTKEEIKSLADIGPDDEASFSFAVNLKDYEEASDVSTADYKVEVVLDYSVDSSISESSEPTLRFTTPVNSRVSFSNEVRYFDNNNIAVGEGPLPPKVGEKTTFKVFWTVNNKPHDLSDLQISATLPANVAWESRTNKSIGNITYDSTSREVVWKTTGLNSGQTAVIDFDISLTPRPGDKNKIVTLINQSVFSALDKDTQGSISVGGKVKTSNLDDDEVGKGFGKVE